MNTMFRSMTTLVALVATLLLALQANGATGTKDVVDETTSFEANAIGSNLCHNKNLRISRFSTIKRLLESFEEESGSDAACRDQWLRPLRELQEVIDASARDACSLETAKLIEEFQWNWVLGTISKRWKKASWIDLPEPLKLFFVHFAEETLNRCEANLRGRLTEAVTKANYNGLDQASRHFGMTTDLITLALVTKANVKNYDNFYLIINALVSAERKKGLEPKPTLDPRTGELKYVSVKVRKTDKPYEFQERCMHQLRPIYINTVLPVMKLIDLGFGQRGKAFSGAERELMAEWYAHTQMCELILPVKFYSNNNLNDDQVSLVKEDEAVVLAAQEDGSADRRVTPNIQVKRVLFVEEDVVPDAIDDGIIKLIKSNFKSRNKLYAKTIKNVVKSLKATITSAIKRIFVSKKRNTHVEIEGDEDFQANLAEAERFTDEVGSDDETSSHETHGLIRHKRGEDKKPNPRNESGALAYTILSLLALGVIIVCILAICGVFGHPAGG